MRSVVNAVAIASTKAVVPNAGRDYVALAAPCTMLHGLSGTRRTGQRRDAAGHTQSGESDVKTRHVEIEIKAPARAHFSRKLIEQERKKRHKEGSVRRRPYKESNKYRAKNRRLLSEPGGVSKTFRKARAARDESFGRCELQPGADTGVVAPHERTPSSKSGQEKAARKRSWQSTEEG